MSQAPHRSESSESEHRRLPMVVPQPAEPRDGWLTRVMRILFGWRAAATRADLELVLTGEQRESGFSPDRSHDAQEHPRPARVPDREHHGAAGRHRRRAAGHHRRRAGQSVRRRQPFASRGLQRHARRSDRHGPHPRPPGVHGRARGARSGRRQGTRACAAGRSRSRQHRSFDAADRGQDRPRNPLSRRRRCRRSICSPRCRRRAFTSRSSSTNTAAATVWSRSRTWSS